MADSPSGRSGARRRRRRLLGLTLDDVFRWFFAANAIFAVVVLGLITFSLALDSAAFFPKYRINMERYRQSGEEFTDILRGQMEGHDKLVRQLSDIRNSQYAVLEAEGKEFTTIREALKPLSAYRETYRNVSEPLDSLLTELTTQSKAIKQREEVRAHNLEVREVSQRLIQMAIKRREQAKALDLSAAGWMRRAQAWKLVPTRIEIAADDVARTTVADAFANHPPAPAAMAGQPGTPVPDQAEIAQAARESGVDANPLVEETRQLALADDGGNPIFAGAQSVRLTHLLGALLKESNLSPAVAYVALEHAAANQDATAAKAVVLKLLAETQAVTQARFDRADVTPIDYKAVLASLLAAQPRYEALNREFEAALKLALAHPPVLPAGADEQWKQFLSSNAAYVASLPQYAERMRAWSPDKPVSLLTSFTGYVAGEKWVTNSDWMDWYGVVPLFAGSLTIAGVALALAIPFGVGAAIYVNELATIWEKRLIKPYIEFIAAIPSVVLGFFGIAVLGDAIRNLSQWAALAWVPGFPIAERLNITTAGILLAFMAVPTIFTLSEDALDNVPREYTEASYALGATRLQTLLFVIIPTSLSGITSAVLLGFGRVIGETMVVLLVAGNRIAIPDFGGLGLGAFFEPVHTMTGIIAQETGEVSPGTLHYHALFVVGLTLFVISLLVNFFAQYLVRRYRMPIG